MSALALDNEPLWVPQPVTCSHLLVPNDTDKEGAWLRPGGRLVPGDRAESPTCPECGRSTCVEP